MAPKEFWITNLSNRIVNLHDLNLFIKPYSSINLLDRRHLALTEKQIYNSATSGSIFKKSDKIVVRKFAPELVQDIKIDIDLNPILPYRDRAFEKVEEEVYEELLLTEEDMADAYSDLENDIVVKKESNG